MKSFHQWKFWERHANYLSGWTRFAAYPFLLTSIYFQDWYVFAATVVFLVINPVLFSKPAHQNYWMTKGVLGEQLWVKKKKSSSKVRWLNAFNGMGFLLFLVSAYYQFLYPALFFGTFSALSKFLFMEEMVLLYESSKNS